MHIRSTQLALAFLLLCSTAFGQTAYPLPATGGSTATVRTYYVGTTSQRGSLAGMAAGDSYFDTDTTLLYGYTGSAWTSILAVTKAIVFKQTADGTCGNTGTETAITSTGVGSLTLPVNFFVVGKTLRILARGYHQETSGSTFQYKLKLTDSTPTAVTIWDSTAPATNVISSNRGWEAEWLITCRTTGASGTVIVGTRSFRHFNATNTALQANATSYTASTIDTTKTQAISLTLTWGTGAVGRTSTMQYFTVEALN